MQSLRDFVESIPHSDIMEALAPQMGKTRFAQWTANANEISLDWKKAKARLA